MSHERQPPDPGTGDNRPARHQDLWHLRPDEKDAYRRQAAARRVLRVAEPDKVILDVDATLVDVESEDGAAATFKGGWGFAPMLCVIRAAGDPGRHAAARQRRREPRRRRLAALDEAIGALPAPGAPATPRG